MPIILIVDDDDIVRRSTKRVLQTCGAEIQEATDGEEALSLLRGGLRPAIIISDVDMPKLNGLRLAIHVKEEFPSLKMVVCSGGDHSHTAETIGVTYLPKPIDAKALRQLVKDAL